jgi:hypothetical protein
VINNSLVFRPDSGWTPMLIRARLTDSPCKQFFTDLRIKHCLQEGALPHPSETSFECRQLRISPPRHLETNHRSGEHNRSAALFMSTIRTSSSTTNAGVGIALKIFRSRVLIGLLQTSSRGEEICMAPLASSLVGLERMTARVEPRDPPHPLPTPDLFFLLLPAKVRVRLLSR